jgi:PAS domain S-box-containing protein
MTTKSSHEELERRVQALETKNTQLVKNLHEARSLSEEVMTYMSEGLVITDTSASIMFINKSLSEMLGYLPEEIIGKDWLDLVPPDQQSIAKEAEAKRSQGYTDRYEIVLHRKNGDKFPVLIGAGPRFDEQSGQYIGSLGVVTDITDRKQAEIVLKESEQFLQILLESIPLPVFYKDVEGRYKGFNKAFETFFGRPKSELIGCSVFDFNPPELAKIYHAKDSELFKKISTQTYESQVKNAYGELRDVIFHKATLTNTSGAITGLVGTIMDITDRKQAEEELKASERRARLQRSVLADLAINHAFAKGEGNDVLRLITRNLTQTLAVSRASIWVLSEDNLKLSCLMLYESDTDVFSSGTELQASGMPRYFKAIMQENRIYAEDAQNDPRTNELTDAYLKPLGITSMLDGGIIIEGRVKGVVCGEHIGPVRKWFPDEEAFISTISALVAQLMTNTERKRAEEALRESEQRYRTILDEMSEGYHEVDLAGNFTFFNEAFLNLFGYSRDEMLGTNFSRYAAEESIVKKVYQTYNEIYQTGNPVRRTEWDIIRKGGQKRTLEYSAAVVRDSENAPKGFRGIVRDITERKQAEAEREKLHAQLNQAQKMESVGRLAGGVAHDFNNMLGVILGHTELALLRTDDKHKLCSDLNEIQNAAKRSADITKQLLAFARKQTISPRQLDLNDTVESMLNMLGRLIGEDIDLVWKPATHLWPVKMDPSQIDQILANLCVNTRDAIDGVGKLTIETGRKTFDDDYCSEHQGFIPGDFVLLAVSDNGCGMDKDTLENIFEPFFTTKEEDKGTGLGLATIYGIVKQNNGFINVYSEPGQGSTFKVYLPRLVTHEDTDMTVPEKKAAAGGIETIFHGGHGGEGAGGFGYIPG